MQKGSLHAPRVVFKEDKNLSRQLSPPWGFKTRESQPISNDERLDNKQVNTFKQKLKDKNFPLVLPVAPKTKTPELDSSPRTPVSASPVKGTTPKKFVFTPQKTNKDECGKTDHVKEMNTTKKSLKDRNLPLVLPLAPKKAESPEHEPSPRTPASVPPASVSTPKSFVFTPQKTSQEEEKKAYTVKEVDTAKKSLKDHNLPLVLPVLPIKADTPELEPSLYTPRISTPNSCVFTTQKTSKDENEKVNTVQRPTPASRTPAPSHSAPAGPSVTATPPTQGVPVVPKTFVPSQTSTGIPPVPNIPAPSIPAPGCSTSASPEPRFLNQPSQQRLKLFLNQSQKPLFHLLLTLNLLNQIYICSVYQKYFLPLKEVHLQNSLIFRPLFLMKTFHMETFLSKPYPLQQYVHLSSQFPGFKLSPGPLPHPPLQRYLQSPWWIP